MREALRAQRDGRVMDAARHYRRVLAEQPSNFDAAHMLSLVEYEIGNYDQAVALIKRAIELRPDLGMPRKNLRLLESLPRMEIEICREVLPRVLSRVAMGFDVAGLARTRTVHVVGPFGQAERDVLRAIHAGCDPAKVKLWDDTGAAPTAIGALRLTEQNHPQGGWLVLLGPVRSMAGWLSAARLDGAALIATRDEPCGLIDRIDELAGAGYAQPALACATPALAARLGLSTATVMTSPVISS